MSDGLKVIVNDEAYLSQARLVRALAALYVRKNDWKLPVAILCDDYLDPSGRLLGLVRDEAVKHERWQVRKDDAPTSATSDGAPAVAPETEAG